MGPCSVWDTNTIPYPSLTKSRLHSRIMLAGRKRHNDCSRQDARDAPDKSDQIFLELTGH